MSIAITDWLRGLGLEQYAPAFRDNDVDSEVLPQLTVDDLISIGVTSVGHRRKLLAAIASLGASAAATTIPTAPVSDASATVEARAAPADRDVLRSRRLDRACRHGSIPRSCARLSPLITAPSPMWSEVLTDLSPSTWVTASWSISGIRARTRTMPSGRSGRGWI